MSIAVATACGILLKAFKKFKNYIGIALYYKHKIWDFATRSYSRASVNNRVFEDIEEIVANSTEISSNEENSMFMRDISALNTSPVIKSWKRESPSGCARDFETSKYLYSISSCVRLLEGHSRLYAFK